jgi:hypothetical protein
MRDVPLTDETIVVASNDQISTTLNDEVVILGLQDTMYYGLQDVGARVWALVQSPRSIREIVGAITAEYDVSAETAASDVYRLIDGLRDRGLVTTTQCS